MLCHMQAFGTGINEVINLESESLLRDSPGPMVEIQFWEAKCLNLECLYDQVS